MFFLSPRFSPVHFLCLRAAFSISASISLLFACRPADFLSLFSRSSAMYPTYLPCVVPRSRKHLSVLLLRSDAYVLPSILLRVYLSIRTAPMRLKLHYASRWKTMENAKVGEECSELNYAQREPGKIFSFCFLGKITFLRQRELCYLIKMLQKIID